MCGWLSDEADLASEDEPPDPIVVLGELRQNLQRDVAVEGGIPGEVDLAPAAVTQGSDDAVVGDEVVGLKGFGHRRLPPFAVGGFVVNLAHPCEPYRGPARPSLVRGGFC